MHNLWASPLYFTMAGMYDGILTFVQYYAQYWSSVADSPSAVDAWFGGQDRMIMPGAYNERAKGMSVRCLAR